MSCTKHRSPTMTTGGGEGRNVLEILWRIENFSFFIRELNGDRIWSPYFYSCSLGNEQKHLILCLLSEGIGSLSLCTNSSFNVDCEFSFLDCEGHPLVTSQGIPNDAPGGLELEMVNCPTLEELSVTKRTSFLPRDTLTVRSRVWKSEGNFPNAEYISGCTRTELSEGSILRPIGKLSEFLSRRNDTFSVYLQSIHQELDFDFKCSVIGHSLQNAKLCIEMSIDRMDESYSVNLEVSVLDNRQEVMKLGEEKKRFSSSKSKQVWVVPRFGLRENLREKISLLKSNEEGLSLLFRLTAVCCKTSYVIEKTCIGTSNLELYSARATVTFSDASCQTSDQNGDTRAPLRNVSTFSDASCQVSEQSGDIPERLKQKTDSFSILSEDLFSLYQQQTFSDFELRCGDVSFPVHKNILCARSPVFSSMFSSKMVESTSSSLDVPDVHAHALNRMLTFLYGGEVEQELTVERAANLYYAADKYQVESLRRLCSSILESQVSVSNVSDLLTLADRHQDSQLTSFVHTYILSHYDDVMNSQEWEKFLEINPVLAGKSMLLLYKKKTSKEK